MRPSSGQPDLRSIGRENVCSPSQDGCCGVYATRPVPEVSPLLKQPVRHHADFSPRGICFSSAARKFGCPILSLGKDGTKSPPLFLFVIPRGLQSAGDLLFLCRAEI